MRFGMSWSPRPAVSLICRPLPGETTSNRPVSWLPDHPPASSFPLGQTQEWLPLLMRSLAFVLGYSGGGRVGSSPTSQIHAPRSRSTKITPCSKGAWGCQTPVWRVPKPRLYVQWTTDWPKSQACRVVTQKRISRIFLGKSEGPVSCSAHARKTTGSPLLRRCARGLNPRPS